ncbi:MAG: ATP-binding protein [Tissierellia bacterium]|nr:ATP-binding protein [Tissierellia bacterium]
MTPRIHIITGHFGSGKTEFSINLALYLKDLYPKVSVVDLDIINMYFRIREQKDFLESQGISVIASSVDAPNLDIPALDPGILTPLQDSQSQVILDVGGNPSGARALGRYRNILNTQKVEHLLVVNANRPETQKVEDVIGFMKNIEGRSTIPVTGLVNSTHMLKNTSIEDVLRGEALLKEVSKETGLSVKYTAVFENIVDECPDELKERLFPIHLYFRNEWMV